MSGTGSFCIYQLALYEYSKGDLVSPFWLSVRQMAIAGWSFVGWLIRGGRGTSYGLYREGICIAGHGWK